MGILDSIKSIFSKSDKDKPKKKKKKVAKKKAAASPKAKKKAVKKGNTNAAANDMDLKVKAKKGKKRKKSKQISADPINEQALGFSISLKGEDSQAKKRKAVRITVDGLEAHVKRLKKKFAVTDISATGLGFAFEKPRVKGGIKLEMDLYLNGELKTSGLVGKVMRHDRGSVGCVFEELDRKQDDVVHEIVLLGQKQMTAKKNAQKDRDFTLPS